MSRVVLDTSAYVAFRMDLAEATRAIRGAREVVLPTVVLGELLGGFVAGTRERENREGLQAFLSSPRVSVATIRQTTSERYAVIYSHLRRTGNPIPTNDLWIAACAMELGAEVLTADRHFEKVPQVMTRFIGL